MKLDSLYFLIYRILKSFDIAVSDSDEDSAGSHQGADKKKCKKEGGEEGGEDEMALRGLATLLSDQPDQQTRIQVLYSVLHHYSLFFCQNIPLFKWI